VTNSVQPSSGTRVQTIGFGQDKSTQSFKIRRTTRDADMNLEPFLDRPGQVIRRRNESNMPINYTQNELRVERIENENEKLT